jgi:hypothetical protein
MMPGVPETGLMAKGSKPVWTLFFYDRGVSMSQR